VSGRNPVRVVDVMELDFAVVDGVATVAEALAMMREKNAHFLIVAKRSEEDEFRNAPTSTRSCPSRCCR
jgi:CBS domain-containing protein